MMKGDLHCHTTISDGSEGIETAFALAKRAGLDFLSITDHDTVATFEIAEQLGKQYGVIAIPGVELSCIDNQRKRKVHMLCYFPQNLLPLQEYCEKTCKERALVGIEMAKKTMNYFPITVEEVLEKAKDSTSVYKQHTMRVLMEHGYTNTMFGDLYRELFGYPDGKVYTNVPYADVYEMLDLIRESRGIAVLAHPYEYNSIELLEELAAKKLIHGVEVYHSRCTKEKEEALIRIAKANDLIITGGSDYHGFYVSAPSPVGNRYTDEESLKKLFDLKEKMSN